MSNNKFCNTELPQKSLSAVVKAEVASKAHNKINMQIKENHDYFFMISLLLLLLACKNHYRPDRLHTFDDTVKITN